MKPSRSIPRIRAPAAQRRAAAQHHCADQARDRQDFSGQAECPVPDLGDKAGPRTAAG